ncbi:MAG: hypothetical protein HXY40_07010 [Chloroflexi bacterium]|nr:hypothetical protein [Chloroflexota bacterium]
MKPIKRDSRHDHEIEEMEESTREIIAPSPTFAPVRVTWDNSDRTALRYDFNERWSWKDLYAMKAIADAMIESVQHPVGVLFVLPFNAALPDNAISNVRSVIKNMHPRVYTSILISNSVYVKTIYNVLKQVYKPLTKSFLHADTLERGRSLLTEMHPRQH